MNRTSKVIEKNSSIAFLKGLIDYAGMFPPSQLPLEKAIKNYSLYLNSKEKWTLSSFVIPIASLDALDPYISLFTYKNPLVLSVLGRKGDNLEESLLLLKEDLKKIEMYRVRNPEVIQINFLEFPFPDMMIDSEYLREVGESIRKSNLTCYCEVSNNQSSCSWENNLKQTLQEIASHNKNSSVNLGVKLRSGGIRAELIPSVEFVAAFIHSITKMKLPTKFTAGLHHPIRMYRDEVGAEMHGFVNIFTAGLLAFTQKLSQQEIAEILNDKNVMNFNFTDETLIWNHHEVQTYQIVELRGKYLHSYGSCSLEVPLEEFLQQFELESNRKKI